ncbi:MAG: hypothetical protein HKP60_12455 [Eudoraea sp.]|nr:hypothetical protein [Eudoraea sp.]NNJ41674.1 hypothetical protein [Eudoraea sp.]
MKTFYITLAIIAAVMIIYHFVIRPKMLRRGVTKNETGKRLAGDEIIRPKPFRSTMAVNLNACPEDIWPWLVQMGWSKAAFYSYNRIESILGMDLHNADHIHPEWQDLNVGDTMWMSHPRRNNLFPITRVEKIKSPKELVFAIYGPEDPDTKPSGVWSFILEPIDENQTRLFTRLQVAQPSLKGKLIFYFFMEPAHFIMQQGMFKGLKKRLAPAPKVEYAEHIHV